jgi:hypothetical protein
MGGGGFRKFKGRWKLEGRKEEREIGKYLLGKYVG